MEKIEKPMRFGMRMGGIANAAHPHTSPRWAAFAMPPSLHFIKLTKSGITNAA